MVYICEDLLEEHKEKIKAHFCLNEEEFQEKVDNREIDFYTSAEYLFYNQLEREYRYMRFSDDDYNKNDDFDFEKYLLYLTAEQMVEIGAKSVFEYLCLKSPSVLRLKDLPDRDGLFVFIDGDILEVD